MAESDYRILITEMRADQKANFESNTRVAKELSSVAKELHAIGKAFSAQTVIVENLSTRVADHEKRIRAAEDAVIADRPFKEIRGWILKGAITFMVAGILGAAFIVNK